jgi:hypothetical protein
MLNSIKNPKSNIENPPFFPLPANPVLLSKIHPKSKIFLPLIPAVAVFSKTPGSGFVEMILNLPIQNLRRNPPSKIRLNVTRQQTFRFLRSQMLMSLLSTNKLLPKTSFIGTLFSFSES